MAEVRDSSYHVALASPVRQRVLEMLETAGIPLTAAELATGLDLHVTTARFHLDHLERAGLVARETRREPRRGHPSVCYRATQGNPAEAREQLISVLAEAIAAQGAAASRRALAAGRHWAGRLDLPAGDPRQAITEAFARLGFEPEPAGDVIRLRSCPFRAAAREHPDVVCQVHLGLAQRIAGQAVAAQPVRVELQPFVEPDLCLLTLTRDEPATAR